MTVLSREEVKIMSGFSEVVAMAVTQPEWPFISPRSTIDSDIVFIFFGFGEWW
jgi:hypothetical protein